MPLCIREPSPSSSPSAHATSPEHSFHPLPKTSTDMSQYTSDNANDPSPVEVVVPYRRMKGWAIVTSEEESEQRTAAHNTHFPDGRGRTRSQTKRSENVTEHRPNAKRKATSSPSTLPIKDKHDHPRIRVGGRLRSKKYNQLEREIKRLQMQNDLLAINESREIDSLKAHVKRLESLKAEQNRKIDRLIGSGANPALADTMTDESNIIEMKEKQIERQNDTIKELQASLNNALRFDRFLSTIHDEELPGTNIDFAYEMKGIELDVIRVADLLSNCLYPLVKLQFEIQIHPDLADMIRKAIRNVHVLSSMPGLALRTLLFYIISNQVIHSEIWTALHVEGYMLRAYQQTIQQSATNEFFERFHRTALLHMIEHDSQFKICFLDAHAEELQTYVMALLDPLLDPDKLAKKEIDIHRELRALLSRAISFRSRCILVDGIRYEFIQFQPGERFDPTVMEARDAIGNSVSVPPVGKKYSIKLCVHGLIVAHTTEEVSSGLQRVKELSQPFSQDLKPDKAGNAKPGEIISDKAIVILQD